MITIKEYAKSRSISYEAARQSLKRSQPEIESHLHKHGRTQYIDDAGIDILDKHRINKGSPELFTGKENPSDVIDSLKNEIIVLQKQIIDLQKEASIGIEAQTKLKMIEANTEKLENENKELKSDNHDLRDELQSYQKTIFGLYRKVGSR